MRSSLIASALCWTLTAALVGAAGGAATQVGPSGVTVVGDGIPDPLSERPGDPASGRRIVLDREVGNCLICHRTPEPEAFQGDVGPSLTGVGKRLSASQIRLRVVDMSRLNAATIMPPYYRLDGLVRVMQQYRGKPVLDNQQVEDVVAYLQTLKAE